MLIRCTILATALLAALPAAQAEDYAGGAVRSMKTDKGEVLTDAKGMTLYTFDKDASGTSNCYDKCAAKWPPLAADEAATAEGDFTTIKRKDGSMQWAAKGMPLYLWQGDKKPGETTGDGVGGVWHVATD